MPSVSRNFGGPVESLLGYAKAAEKEKITVEVAAPECEKKEMDWLKDQLPGIDFYLFKSMGRHTWITAPGMWRWLKKSGKTYDVIHIHGLFNPVSSFSATICRKRGFPYVIRPFGTLSGYTFSRNRWFKKPWFQFIDKPNLNGADGIHFTTEAEFREANRLGIPLEKKKWVVPPPFRGEMSGDITSEDKFKEPVCLYMSRLHPIKNIEVLLHAWSDVSNKIPKAKLLIAGSGDKSYEQSLQKLANNLNLSDSVEFKGFVTGNEKSDLLKKSWVFALPSQHENFGIAVLEAIAAGLPVVISPEVQLADFVKATDTGQVVPREPKEIADEIIQLFKDEDYRNRMTTKGPEEVEKAFSLEKVGRQLNEMYREVASMRGNG